MGNLRQFSARALFFTAVIGLISCQPQGAEEMPMGRDPGTTPYRRCTVQEPDVQSHPLLMASAAGAYSEVEQTLMRGLSEVNVGVGPMGRTPLICAIENGHLAVVELLLGRAGAAPDQTDRAGHPALHFAVWNRQADIARLLLNAGANLYAIGPARTTAMDEARRIGDTGMIALLQSYERPGLLAGPGMGGRPGMGGGPGMGGAPGMGGVPAMGGRPGMGGVPALRPAPGSVRTGGGVAAGRPSVFAPIPGMGGAASPRGVGVAPPAVAAPGPTGPAAGTVSGPAVVVPYPEAPAASGPETFSEGLPR